MRAAIYVRVSTDEQVREGYSISAQLNKLKAFCVSQNWTVEDVYTDEGISAKDTNRPQLKRMIDDVKGNKIDVVLVYRLDRLTRSVFDLYKLLEMFDKHDCKFKSATEVYDTTTAMGRMFITIVAALAQWERENLGERVSMGLSEKLSQGKHPNGNAPFGYDLVYGKSTLIINELEANTVRLIYDKYIKGYGVHRIATYLNNHNLLTKNNNQWKNGTVMSVLKNPVYKGTLIWGEGSVDNAHDHIIDIKKWNTVQHTIKNRRDISPVSVSSDYLFSGLLKCPVCKSNLHGNSTYHRSNGKRYYNYRCTNKLSGICNSKSSSVAESQIKKQVLDRLLNTDYTDIIDNVNVKKPKPIKTSLNKLYKELKEVKKRKKKWQFAWIEELISHDDLKNRMNEETKKETEIKKLIESAENQKEEEVFDVDEIKTLLKDIKRNWDILSRLDKKNLIRSIIKEIKFKKNGRNTVVTTIVYV